MLSDDMTTVDEVTDQVFKCALCGEKFGEEPPEGSQCPSCFRVFGANTMPQSVATIRCAGLSGSGSGGGTGGSGVPDVEQTPGFAQFAEDHLGDSRDDQPTQEEVPDRIGMVIEAMRTALIISNDMAHLLSSINQLAAQCEAILLGSGRLPACILDSMSIAQSAMVSFSDHFAQVVQLEPDETTTLRARLEALRAAAIAKQQQQEAMRGGGGGGGGGNASGGCASHIGGAGSSRDGSP